MGNIMEEDNLGKSGMGSMAMGKCKNGQRESFNNETNSKNDMEDYNLATFTHTIDFFKAHASLKKLIPKDFFTSLLNDLSIKDLLTLGNMLSIKFINLGQRLYVTPSR